MKLPNVKSFLMAVALGAQAVYASAENLPAEFVDAKGNITLPAQYRTNMIHLGSWFVPEGEASGFHGVYTNVGAMEAFREQGQFPDGTVLVKELRSSASGDYTTGAGVKYETAEIKQWFVMVKDSTNRFAGNPSWGDGWGWALFKTDDPGKNASTNYQTDCMGCHIPAKDKDWVAISHDQLSGTWAYLTGRLKVRGDQGLARKLDEIFP